MIQLKHPGLFITGTDTDVGKTYVGAMLVRSLREKGVLITARKPAESGCDGTAPKRPPSDALTYAEALDNSVPLATICPYRYSTPLAPPMAAAVDGGELLVEQLVAACEVTSGVYMVVEGAGGLCSPLAKDGLNIDLAKTLGYPLLVVAANRLGCINHVLLTLGLAARAELSVLAVVLNALNDTPDDSAETNLRWLTEHLDVPVIEMPYRSNHDRDLDRLITALTN